MHNVATPCGSEHLSCTHQVGEGGVDEDRVPLDFRQHLLQKVGVGQILDECVGLGLGSGRVGLEAHCGADQDTTIGA